MNKKKCEIVIDLDGKFEENVIARVTIQTGNPADFTHDIFKEMKSGFSSSIDYLKSLILELEENDSTLKKVEK